MICAHCGRPMPRDPGVLPDGQASIAKAMLAYRVGNGTCLVSISQIALRVGKNRGPVRNAVQTLVDKGYFEVVSVGSPTGGPSRYRPTERMK